MVLDASALIAMLLEEAGHERLLEKVETAASIAIGAPTLLEASIVLARSPSGEARARLTEFIGRLGARVVPFTQEHFEVSRDAFTRFGKGRHPARLNFGDCMAYAIASVAGAPLLYVGDDFSKTDIEAA